MPYDGSGNFTIINNFEEDRINGVSIDSLKMDNNFNDVANGLSDAMLRSGVAAMTGALNMASHKILNVSNGTASTDAVNKGQLDTKATPANITSAINSMLSTLYPVGSIYIGTQSTCPLASLISGSTWTKVSGDKVLQSSSSNHAANTTIAAGLPNIAGTFFGENDAGNYTYTGAFYRTSTGNKRGVGDTDSDNYQTGFDASRSNSIYGNSNTVQPPAYVVNVWRRTA